MQAIDGDAFCNCSTIERLNLPPSVKAIGAKAFAGCSNLRDIYASSTFPAKMKKNSFSKDILRGGVLHVFPHSIDAYRLDKTWSKFYNIVDYTREEMDASK